jgi:hypothetical protein
MTIRQRKQLRAVGDITLTKKDRENVKENHEMNHSSLSLSPSVGSLSLSFERKRLRNA